MKKLIMSIAVALSALSMHAGDADFSLVVPLPQTIQAQKGAGFILNATTVVDVQGDDATLQRDAQFLIDYVKEASGIQLTTGKAKKNVIILKLNQKLSGEEAYQLTINEKNIVLEAKTTKGIFYGIQTLRKSLSFTPEESITFPAVKINDQPRFGYRGMHLDCARHFFPIEFVKRYIDIMALHNMNTFHWHLTDDQGWRVEIKKYPKLAQLGSERPQTVIGHNAGIFDGIPYGGYYTQDQLRDLVKYAAERNITVIPEIDLPGHMLGALKAYPELGCTGGPYEVATEWGVFDDILCAGKDNTYTFVKNVLDEVLDIFPSKYIHIGGDEAPRKRWKNCPLCQKKIKELNLQPKGNFPVEAQLQNYFMSQVTKHLAAKGRKVIGWDEILEGDIEPGTTVMSWRGLAGGKAAAEQGLDAIMTPVDYCYFDYYQTPEMPRDIMLFNGYIPVEKLYSYDPVPADASEAMKKHILGAQANLWSEYIIGHELAEYQVLPRMAALSEIDWMDFSKKDFGQFKVRETHMAKIYDHYGWKYCKQMWKDK